MTCSTPPLTVSQTYKINRKCIKYYSQKRTHGIQEVESHACHLSFIWKLLSLIPGLAHTQRWVIVIVSETFSLSRLFADKWFLKNKSFLKKINTRMLYMFHTFLSESEMMIASLLLLLLLWDVALCVYRKSCNRQLARQNLLLVKSLFLVVLEERMLHEFHNTFV